MAVYHRKPKILSTTEMFKFWVAALLKEKPHLILKNNNSSRKPLEIWYKVKEEINYLKLKNLELDVTIQALEVVDKDIKRFTATTAEIFELKKEVNVNKEKIKALCKLPENFEEKVVDYNEFKNIVNTFNKKASDEIIQGGILQLANRLGYVQIRKIIPTKKSTSRIDWKASMDYKKELVDQNKTPKDKLNPEGFNWLVYRNQSYYLRWSWIKRYNRACTVKNNRVYAFIPTASSSTANGKEKILGNKTKLVKAQELNPLLHTKYTIVKLSGPDSTVIINP